MGEKSHISLEGQARGVTERRGGEGSGHSWPLLPPAHCPGDFSTTKGTGVCGVRSHREERGAGETNR